MHVIGHVLSKKCLSRRVGSFWRVLYYNYVNVARCILPRTMQEYRNMKTCVNMKHNMIRIFAIIAVKGILIQNLLYKTCKEEILRSCHLTIQSRESAACSRHLSRKVFVNRRTIDRGKWINARLGSARQAAPAARAGECRNPLTSPRSSWEWRRWRGRRQRGVNREGERKRDNNGNSIVQRKRQTLRKTVTAYSCVTRY